MSVRVQILGWFSRPRIQFGLLAMLGMGLAPAVQADPIPSSFDYHTEGAIYNTGGSPVSFDTITGPPVIQFEGLSMGTWAGSSSIDLGGFIITPSSQGSTTYNNTPFQIGLLAPALARVVNTSNPGDPYDGSKIHQYLGTLSLWGRLNGTVDTDGRSTVIATFDRVEGGYHVGFPLDGRVLISGFPFPFDNKFLGDLSIPSLKGPEALHLTSGIDGPAMVTLTVTPVPEPAAAFVFLAAIAGLGYHRHRARSRR